MRCMTPRVRAMLLMLAGVFKQSHRELLRRQACKRCDMHIPALQGHSWQASELARQDRVIDMERQSGPHTLAGRKGTSVCRRSYLSCGLEHVSYVQADMQPALCWARSSDGLVWGSLGSSTRGCV